jgi:SET domain-containing protein
VNQVICWTKRDIKKGEELFVWYGRDVDRHWEDPNTTDTKRAAIKRKEKL